MPIAHDVRESLARWRVLLAITPHGGDVFTDYTIDEIRTSARLAKRLLDAAERDGAHPSQLRTARLLLRFGGPLTFATLADTLWFGWTSDGCYFGRVHAAPTPPIVTPPARPMFVPPNICLACVVPLERRGSLFVCRRCGLVDGGHV